MKNMQDQIWETWVKRLQNWGLNDFAALALEAAGPINLIGAQLVYLTQPMLNSLLPNEQLTALAAMLEEPQQTQDFIQGLREIRE